MAEQKIMTRVMKLLELAGDPNATEAERQLAAERAEALMAQHMIDRMDLKAEAPTKVIQDHWDVRLGDAGSEFFYHVRDLMEMVLQHNGIRIHPNAQYIKRDDGITEWSMRRFVIVGFPEDMAYAEQVWFRVFREFVLNINPSWDSSKSLAENTYQFARAGLSWANVHNAATKAGVELPPLLKGGGAKLRDLYKAECANRGETYNKTRTHDAYRNSFVQSYGSTIRRRLDDMRSKAKQTVSDSDKFALAIRSTKERVDEEFYRLFPEFDPAVIRRMREAEAFEAACRFAALTPEEQAYVIAEAARQEDEADKRWRAHIRRAERSRSNYRTMRERKTYDDVAWERGRQVASKVNLNVDPEMEKQAREAIE